MTREQFNSILARAFDGMEENNIKREVAVGVFHYHDPLTGELVGGKIDAPPTGKN